MRLILFHIEHLHSLGAKSVVIKGGNRLDAQKAIDVYYDGEQFKILESPVLDKNNTGAGCTFASSIASQLLLGKSTFEAVQISKKFVYIINFRFFFKGENLHFKRFYFIS